MATRKSKATTVASSVTNTDPSNTTPINPSSISTTPGFPLSASDLLSSGLTPDEVPEISRDGKPGLVYLANLSAKAVIEHTAKGDQSGMGMFELIAKYVVDENGTPLLTLDQAYELPASLYARFSKAIVDSLKGASFLAPDSPEQGGLPTD